jgi:hypothetical protein
MRKHVHRGTVSISIFAFVLFLWACGGGGGGGDNGVGNGGNGSQIGNGSNGNGSNGNGTGNGSSGNGTGNGSSGNGTGNGSNGNGSNEDLPPIVISVEPEDAAIGVRPEAVIVVTFSQPMDTAAVEEAWSSTELPASEVTFVWTEDDTILTVVPDAMPLAEGAGLDPDVIDPLEVAYTISTAAVDTEGVALEEPLSISFSTMRRLHHEIAYVDIDDRGYYSPHTRSMTRTQLYAEGNPNVALSVGDTNTNLGLRSTVSFPLPDLPAGAELESAIFSANQTVTGAPFEHLGDLMLYHITIDDITETMDVNGFDVLVAYESVPLSLVGVFSDDPEPGRREIEVTSQLAADLAYRFSPDPAQPTLGVRTEYRLQFPLAAHSNDVADQARFRRDTLALSLSYLVE